MGDDIYLYIHRTRRERSPHGTIAEGSNQLRRLILKQTAFLEQAVRILALRATEDAEKENASQPGPDGSDGDLRVV